MHSPTAALLGLAVVLVLTGSPSAGADGGHGGDEERGARTSRISSESPLSPTDPDCQGARGLESEPVVASAPTRPEHLVAAWAQDDDRAIVTAASTDGGSTWSRPRPVPMLTKCTGGDLPFVTHPHVEIDARGVVHLAAFARDLPMGAAARTLVTQSRDGGITWAAPVRPDLAPLDITNDFDSFTVEPDTGALLVVWSPLEVAVAAESTFMSRSVDDGATWTRSLVRMAPPGTSAWNRLVALPSGRLVLLAVDSPLAEFLVPGAARGVLVTSFSDDKGRTWSPTSTIGVASALQWPRASAAPDGRMAVTWLTSSAGGSCSRLASGVVNACSLVLSTSSDGVAWSKPTTVDSWHGPWSPSPAVVAHQAETTVVHTRPTPDGGTAEVLVHRARTAGTWRTVHRGTVDLAGVPGGVESLGSYQGAAPARCGAVAAVLRSDTEVDGPVDVFAVGLAGTSCGTAQEARPLRPDRCLETVAGCAPPQRTGR